MNYCCPFSTYQKPAVAQMQTTEPHVQPNKHDSVAKPVLFTLFLLQLLFSGCASVNEVTKAEPGPSAGFLPAPELLSEMRQRYPFHGAWMNMKVWVGSFLESNSYQAKTR